MEEEFTGERVDPKIMDFKEMFRIWFGKTHLKPYEVKELWDEHRKRYEFAKKFCEGKSVLDMACGTAYGRRILDASVYVGIDISHKTLKKSKDGSNLPLITADATRIPVDDSSFESVVSLETIEHLPSYENIDEYLSGVTRVMEAKGVFIVSSPNRNITNPGTTIDDKPKNEFHHFEMDREEFGNYLSKHFENVSFWGQVLRPKEQESRAIFRKFKTLESILLGKLSDIIPEKKIENKVEPAYWIAVCHGPIKQIKKEDGASGKDE